MSRGVVSLVGVFLRKPPKLLSCAVDRKCGDSLGTYPSGVVLLDRFALMGRLRLRRLAPKRRNLRPAGDLTGACFALPARRASDVFTFSERHGETCWLGLPAW